MRPGKESDMFDVVWYLLLAIMVAVVVFNPC
jgi:hypothetical protein